MKRYEAHGYSPDRYGVYDHEKKDFVKNPDTNRTRLYRSMEKAQRVAEQLNKKAGKP